MRTIRRHSRRVSVAVIDREESPAYSRVLTPYYVGGKTSRSLKNNITEVFGMEIAAVGYCRDDAPRCVSARNVLGGRFRKVFLDEKDRVIGAALVGETNDAGVWYQMIRTRSIFPGPALLQGAARHASLLARM